ncbi:class I SAM-dependent methyltransferase [Petroclostridium sp. X23]|uniref:class I SAM-dependent methyltransferase n=1 Tax=Petroclostridium sp. X23 TaxID=3045146 RepID=UPI0024AE6F36|nr:class I SAM-dependent methyltransferase [Petroclostridium sp. X23]WHH61440.1 class I SAM-dependent methyltransferase [Petroclostridium sp. X23]
MWIADEWKDYELIDTGNGEKLERWGKYVVRRPDPQVIWPIDSNNKVWRNVDGHYHRNSSGGGKWEFFSKLPEHWTISYENLKFNIKPMGFKHTGLFPEQAVNWSWMMERIKSTDKPVRVLNLFAYTGGATVAAAYAGAEVCHVDAAKGMVSWAKENIAVSKLADRKVRFIVDDVLKFVQRENRRGRQYEGIIMDPPSYGRGPNGEVWKIEDELYNLVSECMHVLSPNPLFFLINSYTTGLAPTVLTNVLKMTVGKKHGGHIASDEIGLPITQSGLVLPCGASGRWEV